MLVGSWEGLILRERAPTEAERATAARAFEVRNPDGRRNHLRIVLLGTDGKPTCSCTAYPGCWHIDGVRTALASESA